MAKTYTCPDCGEKYAEEHDCLLGQVGDGLCVVCGEDHDDTGEPEKEI